MECFFTPGEFDIRQIEQTSFKPSCRNIREENKTKKIYKNFISNYIKLE